MAPAEILGPTGKTVKVVKDGESAMVYTPDGKAHEIFGTPTGFLTAFSEDQNDKIGGSYSTRNTNRAGFQLADGAWIQPIQN